MAGPFLLGLLMAVVAVLGVPATSLAAPVSGGAPAGADPAGPDGARSGKDRGRPGGTPSGPSRSRDRTRRGGGTPAVRERTSRPRPRVRVPAVLERIAECESGGDPTAVSADGRHRGKYQFALETWRSLGGVGDPAAAPEAEQDRLALALYRREGAAPWPHCGRKALEDA